MLLTDKSLFSTYELKFNKGNSRKMCEICRKLAIETSERRQNMELFTKIINAF